MTDLPYTYKDSGGSELRIGRGYCTASDRANHKTVSVDTPTGEDAVAVARAVLAAAGDTGHEVISAKEIEWLRAENTRLTRERDVAVRELGKALTAERAEHLDVKFDGTRRRLAALEQQFTDLAALVHGHGEDLARLRYRFTEEDDG